MGFEREDALKLKGKWQVFFSGWGPGVHEEVGGFSMLTAHTDRGIALRSRCGRWSETSCERPSHLFPIQLCSTRRLHRSRREMHLDVFIVSKTLPVIGSIT
ncbi:hypothetical protein AVEN_96480-1 [Araneus ventricosus]|uniref:Uncharacterized protein n=1 Tax=Araneus ventricosus TaxID=182803 RepID=A0A4Y2CVV9_ARAVE|nr:hypothetical protein AVEN_96480-1 [Araneus ventricosus]